MRVAGPCHDVGRRQGRDAIVGVPLRGLTEHVRADQEPERPVRVQRRQVLDGVQCQAGSAELLLHVRHQGVLDARKSELAHAHAVHERRELLVKRVLEDGHDQHLLEATDFERIHSSQHVGDVRWVEASAVNRDRFPHLGQRVYSVSVTFASTIRALRDPIAIRHDEQPLMLERGEMLAGGLIAAGRLLLARSPKLHRARGPYCLRGACDGCTARVNGVPNVMTCLVTAAEGDHVETQNVLGSREVDLYEATDLLFPQGFDHHRFLAGAGTSRVLTMFARRMSGLGKLPALPLPIATAERRELEILIVGGGAAGLRAAAVLGQRALLVDDALGLGGSLGTLEPARAAELVRLARAAGAELRHRTTALLLSREPDDGSGRITALLEGPEGASYLRCRRVLVASGVHDATPSFGNNDLPGIVSARAALKLLRAGISLGKRVALVGDGRFARAFADERKQAGVFRFDPNRVRHAKGKHAVTRLVYEEAGKSRELVISAVAFDGRGAPALELLGQLGTELEFDAARGYLPRLRDDGLAAPGVFAAGSCAGSPRPSDHDGERVARAMST